MQPTVSHLPLRTRAVAATIAALVAYHAAGYVPLPGVDPLAASVAGQLGRTRFSIMALGMVPWLSALMLFEVLALALPQWLSRRFTTEGYADPFSLPVLGLALTIAALQAYGVTTAMTSMAGLVADPTAATKIGMMTSMTAGTALAMALAHLVNRVGVGRGFWVMLAGAFVPQFLQAISLNAGFVRYGMSSGLSLLFAIATAAVALGATVAILEARNASGFKSALPVVLPQLLGGVAASWVMALIFAVAGHDAVHLLQPGSIVAGLLTAALAVGFLAVYTLREQSQPLFLPTAALLALLPLTDHAGLVLFGLPSPISLGTLSVVTAVAHTIYRTIVPAATGLAADTDV